MKKTIRCKNCENRVLYFETGFAGNSYLVCSIMGRPVEKDDGCTFGIKGPSKLGLQRPYDVDISSHSTVYGPHSYVEVLLLNIKDGKLKKEPNPVPIEERKHY